MPKQRTKDVYNYFKDFMEETELGLTETEETALKGELKKLLVDVMEKGKVSGKKGKSPKKAAKGKSPKKSSVKKSSAKKSSAKKSKKHESDDEEEEQAGYIPGKSYTVAQLKAFCKEQGLPTSGKKDDLIARLSGEEEPKKTPAKGKGKTSAEKEAKKKEADKKKHAKKINSSAKSKLEKTKPEAIVKKNSSGIFVHEPTLTVWDKNIMKVVGYVKDIDDESVLPLTTSKIEQCREHGLDYVVPDNIVCDNSDDEIDDEDEKSMAVLNRLKLVEDEGSDEGSDGEED
jgi:hypothetical protein